MNLNQCSFFNFARHGYLFILLLFGWGCDGNLTSRSDLPLTFNQVQHIKELADSTQSYELYLPAGIDDKKKCPVILMFDPHGNGKLAVEQGKEAAERYGYILAGSNNSKNGIQHSGDIALALLLDVLKRYPADPQRVYAAGFSGGGRVASALALSSGKIRGIITCAAGLPNFNPAMVSRKFEIYATAGKHDFNYDEVSAVSKKLDQTDWRHLVTAFAGGHAWPPASRIDEAVAWFNLNAMRDGLIPKDKQFMCLVHDQILWKASQELSSGGLIQAANECSNGIAQLDGLYSVKKLRKKLASIQENEAFGIEKLKTERVKITEMSLRDAYMQNFTSQDLPWWRDEINSLNNLITNEKDSLTRQMYSRVKGFLGIVGYSFTSRSINSGDYSGAEKCVGVYLLAEPKNPDAYFFKALLFDKQNNTLKAAENFSIAIKLGFSDASKMGELSAKTLEAAGKGN